LGAAEALMRNRLDEREASGIYRTLKPENTLIDFCSNDYLGFARNPALKNNIASEMALHPNS
jgi:8-amino-7-oxononanoate synthase